MADVSITRVIPDKYVERLTAALGYLNNKHLKLSGCLNEFHTSVQFRYDADSPKKQCEAAFTAILKGILKLYEQEIAVEAHNQRLTEIAKEKVNIPEDLVE